MPGIRSILALPLIAMLALQGMCAAAQELPIATQDIFPGVTATRSPEPFVGVAATPASAPFAGVAAMSMRTTPLSERPSILALERVNAAQMSEADHQIVDNLRAELSQQAAFANFDISASHWQYQQIKCPAFPDYIFLSFHQGPEESGSSHFVAALPRTSAQVRLVSTYAHGLLPFEASWDRAGTFEVFNTMLRQERGMEPLSLAPNWLLIGVCYAGFSGYPVQVLSSGPTAPPTMDMLRLNANQPQLRIFGDQSADVAFSDVSRPGITSSWRIHFDRHGQITHASQALTQQLPSVALKP